MLLSLSYFQFSGCGEGCNLKIILIQTASLVSHCLEFKQCSCFINFQYSLKLYSEGFSKMIKIHRYAKNFGMLMISQHFPVFRL